MSSNYVRPVEELLKEEFGFMPSVPHSIVDEPQAKTPQSESQYTYSSDSLTNIVTSGVLSFEELITKEFPESRWIVNRLIPENGITCISGKPKAGKSLLSLYLSICLATGAPFAGEFTVQKSNVLLISKEDPPRLIKERLKLLTKESQLPLYFLTTPHLYFDTERDIVELGNFIEEKQINVIAIDSLRRVFKGDENSSQVISEVHKQFKVLLEKGVTIIVIHHHGKEGMFNRKEDTDKLRGSSDILAMLDSLLITERKDEQTLKVTQAALRSDKAIPPFLLSFPQLDGENNQFKFIGHVEEEKEKTDEAKQDVLDVLTTGDFNQKDILDQLIPLGKYGSTTVKNVLKELASTKTLSMRYEGTKKIYSLQKGSENDKLGIEETISG